MLRYVQSRAQNEPSPHQLPCARCCVKNKESGSHLDREPGSHHQTLTASITVPQIQSRADPQLTHSGNVTPQSSLQASVDSGSIPSICEVDLLGCLWVHHCPGQSLVLGHNKELQLLSTLSTRDFFFFFLEGKGREVFCFKTGSHVTQTTIRLGWP